MTLPYERTNAVLSTREFLLLILRDPKVPKRIRMEARARLKHYPSPFDMRRLLMGDRDIFGETSSCYDYELGENMEGDKMKKTAKKTTAKKTVKKTAKVKKKK